MGIFDSKVFNSEVFAKYLETVPRVKQNALLKAGILRTRNDLKAALTDQVGGNYITVPMTGRIGGNASNYDGATDIDVATIGSFAQSMIVVGRSKGWEEKDFTFDITGKDFMQEIANQVAGYWDDVDQLTILAILEGIFSMSSSAGGKFADQHTYDITGKDTKTVDATTLNNAIQQAVGANKNIFTLAIMHSQVATNLENLQLLNYFRGTDANGMQKDMALATWNGRTVLIDDDVPTAAHGESDTEYTTYLLGQGAFDYCDCGAKVPVSTSRDEKTAGGKEFLWTRQRKLFAPRGISFSQPSSPIMSPTDAQLKTAARWELVKQGSDAYDHRAIPIAQIKSLG